MRKTPAPQRQRRVLIGALSLGLLAVAGWQLIPNSRHAVSAYQVTNSEKSSLQIGIGGEVTFAATADRPAVRQSLDSIGRFIAYRSGQSLSDAVQSRLIEAEISYLQGKRRGLSMDTVETALAETATERLGEMTDGDIHQVRLDVYGFRAEGVPDNTLIFKARMGKHVSLPAEDFEKQLRTIRDNRVTGDLVRAVLKKELAQEGEKRMNQLTAALPGTFRLAGQTDPGLSPLQAFIIGYSLATDDFLGENQVGLERRMATIHAGLSRRQYYPLPENRPAFGPNGYIHSSPVEFLFEERTLSRFLDRLEKSK
jgi:hypothetical protein